MKNTILILATTLFFSSCASIPNFKYLEMADLNPATRYQHFETAHFEFTYQEGYLNFAKEAAKHIEHAHEIISPILQWTPRSKIHVLVADNADSANGFAMPAFRVGIVLIATPPDQWLSTSYSENWIKLLVFHEYTHVLNIDPTTKWMEALRVIFGDVVRPNGTWPMWMLEGLAVYYETRTSILGRGRSPYYDAIVRSYFNENRLGNGSSKNDGINYGTMSGSWPYFPGGETAYLFGYQLWNQFSKFTKNDQKMGEYSINSSHRVPFFIEGNMENVTGKEWDYFWNSFVEESSIRYQSQIAKIKAQGESKYTKISDSQYSATGGVISPDGQWLAYTETKLDERQGITLHNLKTGKAEKIKDKLQGASMSFTNDSKKLIFSSLGRNTTFTEFSDLWIYDLEKKEFSQITNGMRAKDPQLSPDGKRVTFTVTDHATHILKVADLVLDQAPHLTNIQTIYQPREFSIIGTPHWLNSSEIVFSMQELNQSESKIIQITATAGSKPMIAVQNGKMNRFPFACNQQLYYISDQTGIDNVYTNSKQVTNVLTATQFPFCSPSGELYGSLLTSNGFEIVKFSSPTSLTGKEKIATADAPESIPSSLQSPEIKFSSVQPYSPWGSMLPRAWSPLAYFGYSSLSGASFGGVLFGFDSTGKHQYVGTLGYNTKSSTIDQSLQYTYYGFRPAITLSEESSTSDIAGDISASLYKRTHEARLQLDHLTQWTWSSLRFAPYGFVDWNSYNAISGHQRVSSSDPEYNHPYIPGGGLSVSFSDIVQSKLGYMPEGGSTITTATQARVYQNDFTLWKLMMEYSRFIHGGSHHVFNPKLRYLGSSHPYGQERSYAVLKGKDTRDGSDSGRAFSLNRMQLRGYSDMTFRTKSSIQAGLDYHFPIDTFFTGGGPVFMNQLHGFVFGDATYVPSTKYKNLFLPAFGAGITADTTLFWHAPVSISLEMQYGTNKTFGGDQLFFFSFAGNLY